MRTLSRGMGLAGGEETRPLRAEGVLEVKLGRGEAREPWWVRRAVWVLGVLILLNVSMKVWLALDPHLYTADECYHAVVAKNLIGHPLVPTLYDKPAMGAEVHDYWTGVDATKDWSYAHFWVHKPPMTTWLMAASMAVVGVNELGVRLPSIVIGTGAIVVTYLLGTLLAGKRVGVMAAYFHAIHGMFIALAAGMIATDHVDALFTPFVEVAIWLALLAMPGRTQANRGWWMAVLAGMALGLALLTKYLPALLLVPVVLAGVERWGKVVWARMGVVVGVAMVVFVPWQVYARGAFGHEWAWESAYNSRHLWEALEGQVRPWYQYVRDVLTIYSYVTPLALGWFVVQAVRHWGEGWRRAVVVWGVVPYVFFTCVATRMPNYVAIAAPAIFSMQAWVVVELLRVKALWRYVAVGVVMGLPVVESLVMVVPGMRTSRWRWMDETHGAEVEAARVLRDMDGKWGEGAVLFNVQHRVQAMLYTRYAAYDFLPRMEDVVRLRAAGRPLVVVDDGALPAWLKEQSDVSIVKGPKGL